MRVKSSSWVKDGKYLVGWVDEPFLDKVKD